MENRLESFTILTMNGKQVGKLYHINMERNALPKQVLHGTTYI